MDVSILKRPKLRYNLRKRFSSPTLPTGPPPLDHALPHTPYRACAPGPRLGDFGPQTRWRTHTCSSILSGFPWTTGGWIKHYSDSIVTETQHNLESNTLLHRRCSQPKVLTTRSNSSSTSSAVNKFIVCGGGTDYNTKWRSLLITFNRSLKTLLKSWSNCTISASQKVPLCCVSHLNLTHASLRADSVNSLLHWLRLSHKKISLSIPQIFSHHPMIKDIIRNIIPWHSSFNFLPWFIKCYG